MAVDFIVVKAQEPTAEINGLGKFPTTNAAANSCAAEADSFLDRLKARNGPSGDGSHDSCPIGRCWSTGQLSQGSFGLSKTPFSLNCRINCCKSWG